MSAQIKPITGEGSDQNKEWAKVYKYKGKACDKCDNTAKDLQEMRRHKRDVHGIITGSTSPPTKRKRKQTKATTENCDMDVETVDNISNFSLQVEDMEIDIEVTGDEKVFTKRSDKMDEKVKAKQDRLEEEERRRSKEKIYSEKVKNSENLIKTESLRKINKLRKQKSKTMKKRINKKKKQEINTKSNDFYEIPNLREVPLSCQDLVNKDDLVYVVPGDGACCPNSARSQIAEKDEPVLCKTLDVELSIIMSLF